MNTQQTTTDTKTVTPALIHQTDFFRPHEDPDDHWDVACIFALASLGALDLKGILIDAPPKAHYQPDAGAIAQLNYIYGQTVPFAVGSSVAMQSRDETQSQQPQHERNGVNLLLRTLEQSTHSVTIQIAGSCRDVALALNTAPDLFARKCRAIYLNAGLGISDSMKAVEQEYNVRLSPQAFAALFNAPCPLYWIPCFEDAIMDEMVHSYGSWYQFLQSEILTVLPLRLQNYFAFMLGRIESHRWLEALHTEYSAILHEKGALVRNMWTTAGTFDLAGYTVTKAGEIVARGHHDSVFRFEPIAVSCDNQGNTQWTPADDSNHYIFHVLDTDRYGAAMTAAMQSLLSGTFKREHYD